MVRVSDTPDAQSHVSTDAPHFSPPHTPVDHEDAPRRRQRGRTTAHPEASVGMACIATLMRLVCSPFARARSKSCSQLCVRVTAPAAAARTTWTKHCCENAKSRAEMTIGASTRVGCGAHYPAAWRMHGPRTHPWPICAGTPLLSPVVVVSWLSRRIVICCAVAVAVRPRAAGRTHYRARRSDAGRGHSAARELLFVAASCVAFPRTFTRCCGPRP